MRKMSLIVPFMVMSLGVSTVWADAVSGQQQKQVNQIQSIADIDKKIKEAESYLEKLPVQLDATKRKFRELTAKGDKIEENISKYLKYMDTCSTHELKYKGANMCNFIMTANIHGKGFQEILNQKRTQIQDAINFINSEIDTIEAEMKESGPVREGIDILKRMKDILLDEVN